MRTSFHHQPEAQHPNSSAIHKLAGRLPHLAPQSGDSIDASVCPLRVKADSCTAAKIAFGGSLIGPQDPKPASRGATPGGCGHAEGEPGLANVSGTELTDGGEAGDFKGLRDPPPAPCFRTGAFLLAPRQQIYPRAGGPDPPPRIDDSALVRGFSLRGSKMCYSITSSARPSSGSGIVRPRARAVLRLITSSNAVGS